MGGRDAPDLDGARFDGGGGEDGASGVPADYGGFGGVFEDAAVRGVSGGEVVAGERDEGER